MYFLEEFIERKNTLITDQGNSELLLITFYTSLMIFELYDEILKSRVHNFRITHGQINLRLTRYPYFCDRSINDKRKQVCFLLSLIELLKILHRVYTFRGFGTLF